jgi:plasmid stabilization system protein ParE
LIAGEDAAEQGDLRARPVPGALPARWPCLPKFLWAGLANSPLGHYRIVFLVRSGDEVHVVGVFHGAMKCEAYLE